jgi:TP901 family phage tail tape measure protein
MTDVQSNIVVNIDTTAAVAELKNLQRQMSAFHTQMGRAGAASAASASNLQRNLVNSINAGGQFTAQFKTVATTTETFTKALEANKMSMGQYFRYAGASTKTFGRLFRTEFDTINRVAQERVKTLQTQYVKLGRDANGAMKAIAIRPTTLNMQDLGTKTQIAAQRQALLNQLLKQGSTSMLNFGKNTQWAGRQLMVGFTVPLMYLGTAAAKTFMDIEKEVVRFKRVYGDFNTTTDETNKMAKSLQVLASEFTKYGVAVKDTMSLAADAAAMGKQGADLTAQVTEANRLAVLGMVDQQQALQTTMSLTNAFGVASQDLAKNTDFLNAVENQTVLSIQDLTIAIPKAGPVVKQLGGNVKDLAFFMTAMKEGGINASEGANALKSGLASMINPSTKAANMLSALGVNLKGIVEANKGDLKGTVIGFAQALDKLDPLNRARAIEQLFGKFQFARISTLFQNVIKQGTQAQTTLQLAKSTSEELAIISERELKHTSDSPMYKFQKSVEDLKKSLAPVGEVFLKTVTPVVEFFKNLLDRFNNLDEGTKSIVTKIVAVVAGIGPVVLMTFGLLANGVANIIKGFSAVKAMFNKTGSASKILGEQTTYLTTAELEAAAAAASLDQSHQKLTQRFTGETQALKNLIEMYQKAIIEQGKFGMAGVVPGVRAGGRQRLLLQVEL